jgi:hypothetical protein
MIYMKIVDVEWRSMSIVKEDHVPIGSHHIDFYSFPVARGSINSAAGVKRMIIHYVVKLSGIIVGRRCKKLVCKSAFLGIFGRDSR